MRVGQFLTIDRNTRVYLREGKNGMYFDAAPVVGAGPRVVQLKDYTTVGECKFACLKSSGNGRYHVGAFHPANYRITSESKTLDGRNHKEAVYAR